jgi:hypothetical protein
MVNGQRLFILCLIVLVSQDRASGQAITGAPTCRTCTITVEQVRVLDGAAVEQVGEPLAVRHLSDGRTIAVYGHASGELVVHEPNGSVRVVGRRGAGPGEYAFVQFLGGTGSDIHAFDFTRRRRTVLDASYNVKRVDALPAALEARQVVFNANGSMIVNGLLRTRGQAGFILHRFSPDGQLEQSFSEVSAPDASTSSRVNRRLAPGNAGGVWAAERSSYRIQHFNAAGNVDVELSRNVAWFPPDGRSLVASLTEPPEPSIAGIWQDKDGLLWVISLVADRRWRSAVDAGPIRDRRPSVEVYERDLWLDTVIEVFEPRTRTLLASRRFDQALSLGIVGDGFAGAYTLSRLGVPRVTIHRLGLVR